MKRKKNDEEEIEKMIRKMKKELVITKKEQPKNSKPANEILYEMRYK